MPCEFYLGPGNRALRDHEAVIGNIELKPLFKAAAKANETVTNLSSPNWLMGLR